MICDSPDMDRCTARALKEIETVLTAEGIESETVYVGKAAVRGCIACGFWEKHGRWSLSKMPVVSSQYWNMVHGFTKEERHAFISFPEGL